MMNPKGDLFCCRMIRGVILTLVVLYTIGCVGVRVRPQGELVDPQRTGHIQMRYASYANQIETYRALVSATVESSRGVEQLKIVLVFDGAGRARLEILPPLANSLGYSAVVAWISKDGATFIDNINKQVKELSDPQVGLRSLFGVSLSVDELMMILTGRYRSIFGAMPELYQASEDSVQFLDQVTGSDWTFGLQTQVLDRLAIRSRAGRREHIEVLYNRYDRVGGFDLPKEMIAKVSENDLTINLSVETVKINTQINPAIMSPVVPKDYTYDRLEGVADLRD